MDTALKSTGVGPGAAALGFALVLLFSTGCTVQEYQHAFRDDQQGGSTVSVTAAGGRAAATHAAFHPTVEEPEGRPADGSSAFAAVAAPWEAAGHGAGRDKVTRWREVVPVWFDAFQFGESALVLEDGAEPAEPNDKEGSLPAPRRFADPGLTLDQAINATLLANPKIRAGLEAINQANADLLTSSLPPNPTFYADGQLLPLTRPFTVDRQGGPPQTDYQLTFPIDWFLFGKRAAAMASAAAGVRVSEADYADLVRQKVTETATAYYDVVEAKALLDLARRDVENLRRVESALKKAVDAGGKPVVDLNRAKLETIKSEQDLREAEKTLAVAKAKLRALLGRRDRDEEFDVTGTLEGALTAQPLPVEEALALADENRPDIRSLRLQIEKAGREVHAEKTKAYPQVSPQLGYTHQFQQKAIGFPDADSWLMSVSMTLPVFDRNQGNIAKAKSTLAQNAFNLEAGLVDLRSEIVEVVQEFRTAYRNAGAVGEEQVRLARDVRDAIEKAYQAGGRTFLEVLDAEREYRETYRTYINNRANYWRAVYRFSSAIGKQVRAYDEHPK
jgi:cobalt-zinc-cadmium efflux system outer membrane protein